MWKSRVVEVAHFPVSVNLRRFARRRSKASFTDSMCDNPDLDFGKALKIHHLTRNYP